MIYDELNEEAIEEYERKLIKKADNFFIDLYGKKEATDIDKLKVFSRQGKIQDKFFHDIMAGYFRKEGLWSDGVTTLKEREKQLILKKTEFGMKIASVRDATIADIDTIIKKAKERRDEISKIPIALKEEYKINKQEILKELRDELQGFYEKVESNIEKEVENVFIDFFESLKNRQTMLVDDAKSKIQSLQNRQKARIKSEVENFSSELEAELTVLEYKENDEMLIEQYNEEVRKINQELNEISRPIVKPEKVEKVVPIEDIIKEITKEVDEVKTIDAVLEHPLKQLTVKQLKNMALTNGIEFKNTIRKDDLISLIDAS